jgi:hypothetical protein
MMLSFTGNFATELHRQHLSKAFAKSGRLFSVEIAAMKRLKAN